MGETTMEKVEAGHYRLGIYHARKEGRGWTVTVEDGKGLPFEPQAFSSLHDVRVWLGL